MPRVSFPEPLDRADWLSEVKQDGFRALAHITGHHYKWPSRNGRAFEHWPHV
jgi:ATP-dependent DNA ligase